MRRQVLCRAGRSSWVPWAWVTTRRPPLMVRVLRSRMSWFLVATDSPRFLGSFAGSGCLKAPNWLSLWRKNNNKKQEKQVQISKVQMNPPFFSRKPLLDQQCCQRFQGASAGPAGTCLGWAFCLQSHSYTGCAGKSCHIWYPIIWMHLPHVPL